MTKLLYPLLLSAVGMLYGCSIQSHPVNFYQASATSTNHSIVRLKNMDFGSALLSDIARKPINTLRFSRVDGKPLGFSQSDDLYLAPGKHNIIINCLTNNRIKGQASIWLNTLPDRTYEIAYPSEMYGQYYIDYKACQKLIVR